jgi:hypothetical protein
MQQSSTEMETEDQGKIGKKESQTDHEQNKRDTRGQGEKAGTRR